MYIHIQVSHTSICCLSHAFQDVPYQLGVHRVQVPQRLKFEGQSGGSHCESQSRESIDMSDRVGRIKTRSYITNVELCLFMHVRIGMVGGHKELIDGVLIHAAVNETMPGRRIKVDEAVSKSWLLLGLIWVKECPKNKKSRAPPKKKVCVFCLTRAPSPIDGMNWLGCALDVFSRHDSYTYTERSFFSLLFLNPRLKPLLLLCSFSFICWWSSHQEHFYHPIQEHSLLISLTHNMMYLPWHHHYHYHLLLLESRSRGSCIVEV